MRAALFSLALSLASVFSGNCSLPDGINASSNEGDDDSRGVGRRRRRRGRDNNPNNANNGPWQQPAQPRFAPPVVPPTQPTVAPSQPQPQPRVGGGARRLPLTDPERVAAINRTLDLIESNGPFPFRQDGVVFQNREGELPDRPRGYYHEYTVITPGLSHRGARRIVTGAPPETWYSDDHYRSFVVIDPRRY